MQNRTENLSWELIRLNSALMGWPFIIRRETAQHTMAIIMVDDLSHYQTLHMFYQEVASASEREQMLKAGYQPVC